MICTLYVQYCILKYIWRSKVFFLVSPSYICNETQLHIYTLINTRTGTCLRILYYNSHTVRNLNFFSDQIRWSHCSVQFTVECRFCKSKQKILTLPNRLGILELIMGAEEYRVGWLFSCFSSHKTLLHQACYVSLFM